MNTRLLCNEWSKAADSVVMELGGGEPLLGDKFELGRDYGHLPFDWWLAERHGSHPRPIESIAAAVHATRGLFIIAALLDDDTLVGGNDRSLDRSLQFGQFAPNGSNRRNHIAIVRAPMLCPGSARRTHILVRKRRSLLASHPSRVLRCIALLG